MKNPKSNSLIFLQHVHNLKHPLTCICDCDGQIWVGTDGEGIITYDSDNPNNVIATWNQSES